MNYSKKRVPLSEDELKSIERKAWFDIGFIFFLIPVLTCLSLTVYSFFDPLILYPEHEWARYEPLLFLALTLLFFRLLMYVTSFRKKNALEKYQNTYKTIEILDIADVDIKPGHLKDDADVIENSYCYSVTFSNGKTYQFEEKDYVRFRRYSTVRLEVSEANNEVMSIVPVTKNHTFRPVENLYVNNISKKVYMANDTTLDKYTFAASKPHLVDFLVKFSNKKIYKMDYKMRQAFNSEDLLQVEFSETDEILKITTAPKVNAGN